MKKDEIAVLRRQLLAIRDSGKVNMLLLREVQRLAHEAHYFELVNFIEEEPKAYGRVVMTGKFEGE